MKIASLIQKISSLRLVIVLCFVLAFASCKEDEKDPNRDNGSDLSQEIKNNIPTATLEKLRQMGIKINEGTNPPVFEGIYWLSPLVMTKTEVPDDYSEVGDIFADYNIKLYNQNNKKLTISLDSKGYDDYGNVITTSIGQDGAFISGKGNFFTVYVITDGKNTHNTSRFRMLEVYSGEHTSSGIKNMQNAILMMDNYANVNDDLIPNNTGRAFKDQDGFSESGSNFRKAAVGPADGTLKTVARRREQVVMIKK